MSEKLIVNDVSKDVVPQGHALEKLDIDKVLEHVGIKSPQQKSKMAWPWEL